RGRGGGGRLCLDQRSVEAFPRRAVRRLQAVRHRPRGVHRGIAALHAREEYPREPAPPQRRALAGRKCRMSGREPKEGHMIVNANLTTAIIIGATFAVAAGIPQAVAKECYAPDARAQERAFSRAVITEGGKVIWLG